jgi:hypothetical protein
MIPNLDLGPYGTKIGHLYRHRVACARRKGKKGNHNMTNFQPYEWPLATITYQMNGFSAPHKTSFPY